MLTRSYRGYPCVALKTGSGFGIPMKCRRSHSRIRSISELIQKKGSTHDRTIIFWASLINREFAG
jgi:hypothetical protein